MLGRNCLAAEYWAAKKMPPNINAARQVSGPCGCDTTSCVALTCAACQLATRAGNLLWRQETALQLCCSSSSRRHNSSGPPLISFRHRRRTSCSRLGGEKLKGGESLST